MGGAKGSFTREFMFFEQEKQTYIPFCPISRAKLGGVVETVLCIIGTLLFVYELVLLARTSGYCTIECHINANLI